MPTLTELANQQKLYIDNMALSIFGSEHNNGKVTINTEELDVAFKQLIQHTIFGGADDDQVQERLTELSNLLSDFDDLDGVVDSKELLNKMTMLTKSAEDNEVTETILNIFKLDV